MTNLASAERRIRGVLPVFQTPYLPDESIDFDTLERQIHWLYDRGADGIVMAWVSHTAQRTGPPTYCR